MNDETLLKIKTMMDSTFWPDLKKVEIQESTIIFRFYISPELEHFKGHFPGQPVLPGVVQTHWVCELGKLAFPIQNEFSGMENLKFLSVISCDQEIMLELSFVEEKQSLLFSYQDANTKYSTGRIRFTA